MTNTNEFTLYSGGHEGAESYFGQCAEKFGVNEVTYSFEGHHLKRDKNVKVLSADDLKRGDISMEIVSKHMNRKYHNVEKIKRTLQSIYHMVNNGSQIFAVGEILDDKTAKGGTGWGVELGKFFNRQVHVYDKAKNNWYTWKSGEWVEDTPVISEKTFCGTGTRFLTEESKKAIDDLFSRSFA